MRIGVDIDNTLNDFSQAAAKHLDPVLGYDTEQKLRRHLSFAEAFGWTDEDTEEFFSIYGKKIHEDAYLKDRYVHDILKGLFLRGFEFTVITNRDNKRAGFDVETQTHEWLKKQQIAKYIEDVHFTRGCKHEYSEARRLGIQAMIEDNLERAIPFLENGIPVILFNHEYNRTYNHQLFEHKLLHRVNTWWDVYQVAIDLEKELFNRPWKAFS